MPIMGGTTKDEFTFLSRIQEYFSGPPQHPMTPAEYTATIIGNFGPTTMAASRFWRSIRPQPTEAILSRPLTIGPARIGAT